MAKRGENIYKRKDGRYEGRYVIGKTSSGKTRFGYVYAHQYAEVRCQLLQKKAEVKTVATRFPEHTKEHWQNGWNSGLRMSFAEVSNHLPIRYTAGRSADTFFRLWAICF